MAAGAAGEPIGVGTKDPDSILNYTIDWTDWLDGLSISGSTWAKATGSSGITVVTTSITAAKKTNVLVSGGTAGETYKIINRITTSTSTGAFALRAERSIAVNVLER